MIEVLGEAARALRRDLLLTAVMVTVLASAVVLWQLGSTLIRQQQTDPLRGAPSLYTVALERDGAAADLFPGEERIALMLQALLAPRDAAALAEQAKASRVVLTAAGVAAAQPDGGVPEEVGVRAASRGLFEMFRLPFRFGAPWSSEDADEAVLDDALNQRWFGGRNSVGSIVRVGRLELRIAGVLLPEGAPRNFDRVPKAEGLFVPMAKRDQLRIWPDPVLASADPGRAFTAPMLAEDGMVSLWIELSAEARAPYEQAVARYAAEQRDSNRLPRIRSGRLVPYAEWQALVGKAEGVYEVFGTIAALVLAGSALNLLRLWMVRFNARAADVGLRRALGQTVRRLVARQLAEAALIGVLAGALAALALAGVLPLFNVLIPFRPMRYFFDGATAVGALTVAPLTAMLAALYPSWRFASASPAQLLRRRP